LSSIRTFALVAVACFALVFACSTPSIPIPPPERAAITFDHDEASGTATFAYTIPRGDFAFAVVYVLNRDKGEGTITSANGDGTVDPTVAFSADVGDQILVTFDVGDQLASICVMLVDGTPVVECGF